MKPSDSTTTTGSCSSGISSSNKTGTSCTKLSSEFMVFNIDDLPELLLVEILCRLPSNKFIFQCKCVSKRWCKLISSPHFVRHFVNLQRQLQKPILSTLVFENGGMFLPWLEETRSRNRVEEEQEEEEDKNLSPIPSLSVRLPFISDEESLFVVGACNDLLLCCPTKEHQRDYYICNPYTKQWVSLPPPSVHEDVIVGFICDPYYSCACSPSNKKMDITASAYSRINDIQLCAEYRCRVVRILPNSHVDIFFAETGEWRESVNAVLPGSYVEVKQAGVAHNGKLYWSCSDDYHISFTVELDPFATHPTADGDIFVDKCRFIADGSVPNGSKWAMRLGACRGFLRACERAIGDIFNVWELEEEADQSLKWSLIVNQVSLYQIESHSQQRLLVGSGRIVLGFHPDDEDIMYLNDDGLIIKCNLRSRTLEPVLEERIDCWEPFIDLHPFALPWWPTPVPMF